MHSFEFKPLASVHCHQADRIQVNSCSRNLTQIALFGKQHELPDAIEGAADLAPQRLGVRGAHVEAELATHATGIPRME